MELYSVFGHIISAVLDFLPCPLSVPSNAFLFLYLAHYLSLSPHCRQPLLLPHPHLSQEASRNCIWSKEWRDVGDADIQSGRKEAWKQGRSCLHRSSPEEKTETWMLRGGGGAERGGDRKEREEWEGEMNGSEHPPNTVINCLPSIIRLRPKAAAASSASALCTVHARGCVHAHVHIYRQVYEYLLPKERVHRCTLFVFVLHWEHKYSFYKIQFTVKIKLEREATAHIHVCQ